MTDTLYTSAAYNPLFVGGGLFTFSDSPAAKIVSCTVNSPKRVSSHAIPGTDGVVILGVDEGGLEISVELEIESTDIDAYNDRRIELENVLNGASAGKSDFYLRFVDSSNYWVYKGCAVTGYSAGNGRQDPKGLTYDTRIKIELLSEDPYPTIKQNGSYIQGDTDPEDATELIGATKILITDELIVQNSTGDIKCRISAALGKIEIVGTIEQTL